MREDVNLCVVWLISVFRVSYYKDIVWGKLNIVHLDSGVPIFCQGREVRGLWEGGTRGTKRFLKFGGRVQNYFSIYCGRYVSGS